MRRLSFLALVPGLAALAAGCGDSSSSGSQCNSNDDCAAGFFCDTSGTHQCQTSACQAHSDCPPLHLCSATGTCYDPLAGQNPECRPDRPGCECTNEERYQTRDCVSPLQPAGVDKSCHTGITTCDGERFGPCEDVFQANCDGIHFGPSDIGPTDGNSSNVKPGVEGELQLDPDSRIVEFGYMWIANTGENTVSKIDIETGHEVARYASVMALEGLPEGPIPYPTGNPNPDTAQGCLNCPSRTAIDFNGDAFVANRAFYAQASVTKFANDLTRCVDRDLSGSIDTSTDANGDGVIDVNDPNEFLGRDDECLLWTVPVGHEGAVARSIAIDAGSLPDGGSWGNVWVGLYEEARAVMLNGDTGAEITSVALTDGTRTVHPYGAALDGLGYVWFTGLEDGLLARVDTLGGVLAEIVDKAAGTGCSSAYGIAVDVKNRVWLGGWTCNTADRYDPADGTWATIDFAAAGRGPSTRGIAPDLAGNVWVAHTNGWVSRFGADDLQERDAYSIPHHLGGAELVNTTIGVGIDRNGAAWVVSQNQGYTIGTATRIVIDGAIESFPVGLFPYTYSDFTGFGMTTVTRPSGWYNMVVAGCEDPDPSSPPDVRTDWKRLTWAETEPPDSSVRMRIKVADTVAGLQGAEWFGPWDDPDQDLDALGVPDSSFMLLQVLLSATDLTSTPSFVGFDLSFDCEQVIIPE
jgi:streptogramin lyase